MSKDKTPKIEIPKGKYLEDIYWETTDKLKKENGKLKNRFFLSFLVGFCLGFLLGMGLRE